MRNFKSILVLLCLSISTNLLLGQSEKEKIQFGLHAGIHTFGTNQQFTLGSGQSFGAWITLPLQKGSSRMGLALAHRQLNGYYQEAYVLTESVFPAQIHRQMDVDQLLGFSFWDLEVSWTTPFSKNKRWRWGGGLKLAALDRVRGESNTVLSAITGELLLTETGVGYEEYNNNVLRFSAVSLDQNGFATLDLGAFLQLSYELVHGLTCTATYYQGGVNLFGDVQFPGQATHRLSQFSIGIGARLY